MMTSKRRKRIGDVVQISLPDGKYAYGRVYREGNVGVYTQLSDEPEQPPIGSRNFQFHVGIFKEALRSCPVVGYDPFLSEDESWPPAKSIRDPISGGYQLYIRGQITPATATQCMGLEPVAGWNLQHLVEQIMGDNILERPVKDKNSG